VGSTLAAGIAYGVAALSASPIVVGVVFAVANFGFTLGNIVAISVRQTAIPNDLLGRVTSVYRFLAVGVMPIGALIFQRVTLAGLSANLVAVPCMAVAQIAAMVTTAADAIQFERLASLSGWLTHLSVRGLIASAALVDWAPWLTWRVPSPLLAVVVTYYLAVSIGLQVRSSSMRRVAGVTACVLFSWMAIAPPTLARRFGDGRLHLTMLDVGQGDAMLVTFPNGRTLLVDAGGVSTGGGFDVGDRVIGPSGHLGMRRAYGRHG
jgi:competence protein ComEC